ncbi:hypothetical protein [Actinophytocola gossypii]|uniref:Glycosyltransferase n=1 Tax=Actinophytocola gossypii TaxID=2812003 RepID=A0ABT2J1R5_9PSEU|nr:hypothetical protein [Actinophytocola gossypii]MCT2581539.1 hypothetical protein [Actinophytocola gossypii]
MTPSPTERTRRRRETRSSFHHENHRTLISVRPTDPRHEAEVDAIIVPTGRPAKAMRHAVELAAELKCTLLALCSRDSHARQVADQAAGADVDLVAIDVRGPLRNVLPRLRTSWLMENSRFERRTDTSLKRNLGLLIAHLMDWRRIVFLDDDIIVPRAADLKVAAGLTDRHDVVGLNIGGYPDNSVVCHAYREAGGPQSTFLGGGALAVGADALDSFFPNIYNEDWFFLLGESGLRPTALTGHAVQQPYDPFAHWQRARYEELGDLLAEGLFALLEDGKTPRHATYSFWRGFLVRRFRFINDVMTMVRGADLDPDRRGRMLAALIAAGNLCQSIRADQCVRYLSAWRADRSVWRAHLEEMYLAHGPDTRGGGLDKLVASLGLTDRTWRSRGQRLDQDPADLDRALPVAVGQ